MFLFGVNNGAVFALILYHALKAHEVINNVSTFPFQKNKYKIEKI